jgi:putative MATE family efflux protein
MATRDLTQGSVLRNMVGFSLPYLLSYFMQLLYGLVDLFVIGLYGEVAGTTAVSVGSQFMHFLTVMIVGLAMGTTVTLARAIGAKDERNASRTIGTTVSLFISLGIIGALVLLALVKPIVHVMATPAEAVEGTAAYLRICFIGIPFITAYNVIASIFRGLGDSKSPMYFVAVACVLNIALDFIFIGYMNMGPSGAALGTTLSQTFSVIVSLIYLRIKGLGIKFHREDLRVDRGTLSTILKIGTPVALQDGFIQIAFLAITIIANNRGLIDSAAVGIVEKLISMLFLVPSAMLSTVSTMTAQNIGAGYADRCRQVLRYALTIAVSYGILVALVIQFTAEPIVGWFTSDPAVIKAGGQYFRSYVIDAIFAGVHFCFSGYFVAYGYSIVSFIHNVASIVLARVPLSYILSINFPETLLPMGFAAPAGSLLSVLICLGFFIYFRRHGKL